MASDDPKSLDDLNLSEDERSRLAAREHAQLDAMAHDVAARYDGSRLGHITALGAGQSEKLDPDTRRRMEAQLGGRFGDVRIVRGSFADRVTRRHGADAVTVGSTGLILMRDTPRTNLRTTAGRAVLAHELTHVRQAQAGLNFAHEQGSGSGAAHEQEARAVEAASAAGEKKGGAPPAADPEVRREKIMQRVLEKVAEARRLDADLLGFDDK